MSRAQIDILDEIIVDSFAGGGGEDLPEWCGKKITTMAELEKVVAV